MFPLRRLRLVIASALATLLVSLPALAGPPLLCFPFQIGGARSLPVAAGDWNAIDTRYDTANLVADTLAILTPDAPVVVRMETLRRATLYAARNGEQAKQLLDRLQQRAAVASAAAPLAVFDFGYLVETYKQGVWAFGPSMKIGQNIDGYTLVEKAAAMSGNEAMEFALAVMTRDKARGADVYRTHLQRTIKAAQTDAAIQANLGKQFGADLEMR